MIVYITSDAPIKTHVIPSQCVHWRGNPFHKRLFEPRGTGGAARYTDCHTSDLVSVCLPPASIEILDSLRGAPRSLVRNDIILMTLPL